VWRALVNWWDALELWLTQLAFPFQVLFAIVVLLPVCWGAAALIDRLSDVVALRLRQSVRLRRRTRV
jgi:hypothetical protein